MTKKRAKEKTVKEEKKRLTKKQKVVIIAAACFLVAAIAVVVPVSVISTLPKVAEPYFAKFDQLSDSAVVSEWKKVYGAKSYSIEYVFADIKEEDIPEEAIKKATVTENRYSIARQKGAISLRVRANIRGGGEFSEWITMKIEALKPSTPQVSIDSNLVVNWGNVYYDYMGERVAFGVFTVEIEVAVEDEILVAARLPQIFVNTYGNLPDYIKAIKDDIGEALDGDDLTVTVRVFAEPLSKSIIAPPTPAEKYLMGAYVSSDAGTATITVTQDMYEAL